ncbi:MAG TPA: hypothetical protein VGH31_10720 [Acidimicrobiales bacterium]
MSTLTKGLPAEVNGETSAARARDAAGYDYVMLPIARKWGERRALSAKVIAFAYVFTGVSVFTVTALVR